MIKSIEIKKKTGQEQFIGMEHTLLDYWAWAHSDVASNAERGRLAEFIVKCALEANSPHRIEWDAVDVVSSEGIKVEVKSSAYLQTWKQNKLSTIQFDIAPKIAWDSENNLYSESRSRMAEVYVFCLFASKDPETADPLNLSQWEFYVLNTQVLNDRIPFQKSIGIGSLLKLGAKKVDFENLHSTVISVACASK